jgi:cytochrome c5
MTEEHSSPIKTPKQLVIVVLLAFLVPITLAALISQLVTSGEHGEKSNPDQVLARIQPVGTVVLAEATGPKGQLTGEQVFNQVCKTCHETGLAGSPKFGDKAAWAHVVAQGEATTFQHAINGFKAMPPRGGNSDLTDDEVKRAVAFMVGKVGTNWTSPPVTAAPAATTAAAAPAPAPATAAPAPAAAAAPAAPAPAPAAAAAAAAPAAAAGDGKKIYDTTCVACHGAGIAGAPKCGDKAAWAPRLKAGMATLYNAALHGLNAMPPKGGNTTLSDADVKAAVDYMVSASK